MPDPNSNLFPARERKRRGNLMRLLRGACPERNKEILRGVYPERKTEILRGACPERIMEILRFAQNDRAKGSE